MTNSRCFQIFDKTMQATGSYPMVSDELDKHIHILLRKHMLSHIHVVGVLGLLVMW